MARGFKPEEQEIWWAIRYLDPDQEDQAGRISALIPALALLVVILMVWLLLHLLLGRV
jgi:hypothetical protein